MTTVNRQTILEENRDYWTGRASGYSEVSRLELNTAQRQKWKACLRAELARQFPDRGFAELRVLEVGTGPGFFAIRRISPQSRTPMRISRSGPKKYSR